MIKVALQIPMYSNKLTPNFARMNDILRHVDNIESPSVEFDIYPASVDLGSDATNNVNTILCSNDTIENILRQSSRFLLNRSDYDLVHIVGAGLSSVPFLMGSLRKPVVFGPNIGGNMDPWDSISPTAKEVIYSEIPDKAYKLRTYGEHKEKIKSHLMKSGLFKSEFVAFSNYVKYKNLNKRGIPPNLVTVLPSGVCRDVFYPKEIDDSTSDFRLLYVGRPGSPSIGKGSDIIISALEKLHDIDYKLTIIGNSKPHASVKETYDKIRDDVNFVGTIPRRELAYYYNMSDVYVNPSIGEAESTTLIEALSCGTPSVVSDNTSFREIGKKDNCIYFETRNVDELAESIRNVHQNYEYYSSEAKQFADTYDISNTYDELTKLYRSI